MRRHGWRWFQAPALMLAVLVSACVETETVFVETKPFEDPPTAAAGFLGYNNSGSKVPVCGNCHIGQQSEWKGTKHARAWADLQATGRAQESCAACHSVSDLGNAVTNKMVAYAATKDARYHDVQCESCHGPGLDHVTNPDSDPAKPYASLVVGTNLTTGCGECHQGTHNPFVEEWSASRHSNTSNSASARPAETGCPACHEARGILAAWGVKADYIEKTRPGVIPITCSVCHDPHDPTNTKQLRFPINVANIETNLCMKCHHRRSEPDPNSSRGPHAPQGPLLIGEGVGWVPPSFQFPPIVATHGSSANPRLCAGCHVNRFEIRDAATGNFVFNVSGHLFKPTPCVDAQGKPTGASDCPSTERSYRSCAVGGCHGSQAAARSAELVAEQRANTLAATIDALLTKVPSSEFRTGDNLITVAEGARFNSSLGKMHGSAVHNPFLIEALLTASIKEVQTKYGVTAPAGLVLDNILGQTR